MAIYKKHRSWYIDYYVKGVRKRKKIGPSKHVANLALAQVKAKMPGGSISASMTTRRSRWPSSQKNTWPTPRRTRRPYQPGVTSLAWCR
jgi:hypothetical protein